MKKISAVCVISAICGLFCFSGVSLADDINTPTGMVAYLKNKQLPTLKTIDLWEGKFGTGLKLNTAHYEIYTTLLDPLMLSQVPGFVESAYRGYESQLPKPIETSAPLTIYLFANRQQWEVFTKDFTGAQSQMYLKIKAGAYYLNGSCVAYNIGRERTFSVLGHEGWHQFNSRLFKYRLPSWLDEGIAMQFEITEYDRGFFKFTPDRNAYRLGSLKQTLLKDEVIPLKTLVSLNPGEVVVENDEAVAAFYSQAYALVRFLREDDYGKRLAKYQNLLFDGLNGRWPMSPEDMKIAADRNIPITIEWNREIGKVLFEHYIDSDYDKIEQEYLTFCRKITYSIRLK
jgi:hypothetical protein